MNWESLVCSQWQWNSRGFRTLFTLILLSFLEPYKMIDVLIYIYSLYRATIYWSAWWFGTFFIFPYIGNVLIPIDFHIFQRGRLNHQPVMLWFKNCQTTSRKGSNSLQNLCSGLCGRKHCSSSMLCLRSRRGTAMGLWMVDMDIYIYTPMVNDG